MFLSELAGLGAFVGFLLSVSLGFAYILYRKNSTGTVIRNRVVFLPVEA